MLHKMQPRSKLRNTPYRSLEWQYLVQSDTDEAITSSDILGKFCDETDVHSDIDLNFLVGTPTIGTKLLILRAIYLRIFIYSW